jgi:hypothetical protein
MERAGHGSPLRWLCDSNDDRRPRGKRGFVDIVMQSGLEAPYTDRRLTESPSNDIDGLFQAGPRGGAGGAHNGS